MGELWIPGRIAAFFSFFENEFFASFSSSSLSLNSTLCPMAYPSFAAMDFVHF